MAKAGGSNKVKTVRMGRKKSVHLQQQA